MPEDTDTPVSPNESLSANPRGHSSPSVRLLDQMMRTLLRGGVQLDKPFTRSPLLKLAKARLLELQKSPPALDRALKQDYLQGASFRRKLSSLTLEEVLRVHLSRGIQAYESVALSMTVDGPLDNVDMASTNASINVAVYACYDVVDKLLPWIKESSAYCACRCFNQTETNAASLGELLKELRNLGLPVWGPGIMGHGDIGRVSKWIMMPVYGTGSFQWRHLRIGENLLYCKRGCPPAMAHCVLGEYLKHSQRVCRPIPTPVEAEVERRERIKRALRTLVQRIFRHRRFSPCEGVPSENASFDNGRAGGGSLGSLVAQFFVQRARNSLEIVENSLAEMKFRKVLDGHGFLRDEAMESAEYAETVEPLLDRPTIGATQLDRMVESRPGMVEEYRSTDIHTGLLEQFGAFVTERVQEVLSDPNYRISVRPSAVVEPCKIRMITLGDAACYYRLSQVQKFLWQAVGGTRWFEYSTKPIEDFRDVLDPTSYRHEVANGSDRFLVSGDFSAATDNLNPELSEFAWDCISEVSRVWHDGCDRPIKGTFWYRLVKLGLTGHRIHYPDGSVQDQTWGQLMGSPVSFPILNLINGACVAAAASYHDPTIDLDNFESVREVMDSHSVRTNGDDLFFVTEPGTYETWKLVAAAAGLHLSLGKNYTSQKFFVMNSEMRILMAADGPWRDGAVGSDYVWQFQAFASVPLIKGMEAKGPDAGKSIIPTLCWSDLKSRADDLLFGCHWVSDIPYRRMKFFFQYHQEVLDRVPATVSYFIPTELGGLGLPLTLPLMDIMKEGPVDWCDSLAHEGALLRAAYLACLDVRTRLDETSPVPAEPATAFEAALGSVMLPVGRLSHLRRGDDERPLALWMARIIRRNGQVNLGQLLRAVELSVNWEQMTDLPYDDTAAATKRRLGEVMPGSIEDFWNLKISDRVENLPMEFQDRSVLELLAGEKIVIKHPILARMRRERQALIRVKGQNRKMSTCSLKPMAFNRAFSWRSPNTLVTTNVYASERVSIP